MKCPMRDSDNREGVKSRQECGAKFKLEFPACKAKAFSGNNPSEDSDIITDRLKSTCIFFSIWNHTGFPPDRKYYDDEPFTVNKTMTSGCHFQWP